MTRTACENILLIGIGNPLRMDDAVGRVVVRRIQQMLLPAVHAIEHDGEGTALMELWKEFSKIIVVDALSSGAAPGTIRRFNAVRDPLSRDIFPTWTHTFGLNAAIELTRALEQLPTDLIVYGVEGKSFGYGEGLSPEVHRVIPQLVDRLVREAYELKSACSPEIVLPTSSATFPAVDEDARRSRSITILSVTSN